MSSKKSLVTTTEIIFKEMINDMGTKPNMVREAITPSIAKNNFYTVKKNHKHLKEKNPSEINQIKVNDLINQGLLKELKQKTK